MSIDDDGSLKFLALLVALAAYIANIRREMVKASAAFPDKDIKKKEKAEIDLRIIFLVLADFPLVLASIIVLFHLYLKYGCQIYADHFLGLPLFGFSLGLFSFAVVILALMHFFEWARSIYRLRKIREEFKIKFTFEGLRAIPK